jgi:hypothetical protein
MYVPSLVKIHWRMLIPECSQGCYAVKILPGDIDLWYRYTILWVAFLDPSDSYFLFADLVGFYTHWTYMHIFLSNYWWQRSDIWSQAKQEVGIWRVKKRFPRYGVPMWSLWPNIRFLPSIVAEKNATKNEHICSMCRTQRVINRNILLWFKCLLTALHVNCMILFYKGL